jgi:acetoin utilization protein AcuB
VPLTILEKKIMLVKDRMTPNPITILPDSTHKQATELLREKSIHHLPVVNKSGELVGMVVEQDLLAAQPSPATTLSIYEIHGLLSKLQLKQIMSTPVFTTTPDCPLEEAARLMLDKGIGSLPVMENNRLVGIITDTDIFRALSMLLGGGVGGARFTLHLPDKPGVLAQVAQIVAEAGGNIVSVTTWDSKSDGRAYITIKEQGANFAQLKPALDTSGFEVVEARDQSDCNQHLYK